MNSSDKRHIVATLFFIGVFNLFWPFAYGAPTNLNLTINANILNNICHITLDTSVVRLPVIKAQDFNTSSETPTDYGTPDASFAIKITGCDNDSDGVNKLHMRFQPGSGVFPTASKQVFINESESDPSGAGAKGVGVDVFYHPTQTNVLKTDGTSDVVIPVTSQYQGSYSFDARYQKVDEVSGGMVRSNVIVSVDYE